MRLLSFAISLVEAPDSLLYPLGIFESRLEGNEVAGHVAVSSPMGCQD